MRRLAARPAAVLVGSAATLALTAPAAPASTSSTAAPAIPASAIARTSAAPRADAGQVGHWKVKRAAPGSYVIRWTSPTRMPYTDARPEIVAQGGSAGPATVSRNGRSVSVSVDSDVRPDPADYDVLLAGRPLDSKAQPPAAADVPYARPRQLKRLLADPGDPGFHEVVSSDYSAAPVKLPDIPQKAEMVGHVVEAGDATDASPFVLFLHGRHQPCYRPSEAAKPRTVPLVAAASAWQCPRREVPVPSYLGYRYVQRLLASQGYVTVSISANAINALDYNAADGGAAARAALIRHHLDEWVDFVASGTHHADLDNVILVGHSRGGEGADRAALNLPVGAGYHVTGQVLIGPTDFGFQAAPFTPTVTILPYCDGDVSDLQGQNFTDDARDLTSEPIAFHSSALVMGANHNFFNTEWTPGISAAPSFDDWFGRETKTCGTATPMRLTAAQQRAVGESYIAGAVHLFADDDQTVLPMFDGSAVSVPSAGNADVRTHAIGGGFEIRRPALDSTVAGTVGASLRLCTGVADASGQAACEPRVPSVRTPHWPSRYTPGVPLRKDFDLHWTGADQSATAHFADPWDLSDDAALNIRTIVDPTFGRVRLDVELFDGGGGTAIVRPDNNGVLLPLPGGGYSLAKRWAQTLRVPLDGVTGVDLTDVVSVGLIGRNPDGRVWLLDMSSEPLTGVVAPTANIPLVGFGEVRQLEGDGPGDATLAVPYHVTGDLAVDATLNVTVLDPFGRTRPQTEVLTIPAHTTDGSFDITYQPNTVYDVQRRSIYLFAYATHGIQTDRYDGRAIIIDDDPAPTATVAPVVRRIAEGDAASWKLTLSAPFRYTTLVIARPVRAGVPGPQLTVGDLPPAYRKRHFFPIPPLDTPLFKTELRVYKGVRQGRTSVIVSLPTRADSRREGLRSITLRFHVHGIPGAATSTVKVADRSR